MTKTIKLIIVSIIPIYKIRLFLYRNIFKFKIDSSSYVGMFNILNIKTLEMEGATINYLNYINVDHLKMYRKSLIHKKNIIKSMNGITLKNNSHIFSNNFIGGGVKDSNSNGFNFTSQNIMLGCNSEINRRNYLDVLRPIVIGDNVVFGGEGSEIWTHGYDLNRNLLTGGVTFGDNIFIGSKCTFTKNISISDNVTIGPGSVIYKSIKESGFYTTHQIVKVN